MSGLSTKMVYSQLKSQVKTYLQPVYEICFTGFIDFLSRADRYLAVTCHLCTHLTTLRHIHTDHLINKNGFFSK